MVSNKNPCKKNVFLDFIIFCAAAYVTFLKDEHYNWGEA